MAAAVAIVSDGATAEVEDAQEMCGPTGRTTETDRQDSLGTTFIVQARS